jgi:hypothetical protein
LYRLRFHASSQPIPHPQASQQQKTDMVNLTRIPTSKVCGIGAYAMGIEPIKPGFKGD